MTVQSIWGVVQTAVVQTSQVVQLGVVQLSLYSNQRQSKREQSIRVQSKQPWTHSPLLIFVNMCLVLSSSWQQTKITGLPAALASPITIRYACQEEEENRNILFFYFLIFSSIHYHHTIHLSTKKNLHFLICTSIPYFHQKGCVRERFLVFVTTSNGNHE